MGFIGMLRRRQARRWVRAAREAQARGDWPAAARAYATAANLARDRPDLLVQHGHAAKEAGDVKGAAASYREAARSMPGDIDVRLHLAAILQAQREDEAAKAIYLEILNLAPNHAIALARLAQVGGRELVGLRSLSRRMHGSRLREMDVRLGSLTELVSEWVSATSSPVSAYDLFRATFPTPPPPARSELDVTVVVDAHLATAAMVRVTLASLADQTVASRRTVVIGPDALRHHPVASALHGDPPTFLLEPPDSSGAVMFVEAGVWLDPQALAWHAFALRRTDADAVYGDYDERLVDWPDTEAFSRPHLLPAHDPITMASTPTPPPAALLSKDTWDRIVRHVGTEHPRNALRRGLIEVRAIHVPRRLTSLHRIGTVARGAPKDNGELESGEVSTWVYPTTDPGNAEETLRKTIGDGSLRPKPIERDCRNTIGVVIATRDNPAMAAEMVRSLCAKASDTCRIEFVVLDNGRMPASQAHLQRELAGSNVAVLHWPGPFNWSLANNQGAAAIQSEILVFANDDMRMDTDGWDDRLVRRLSLPNVGAVGARLLYENRTIQHAGILFGTAERGLSVHEGVGEPSDAGGPDDRWRCLRAVSAVTGAFLAVARETFDRLDGFDPRFAIAYNDIDFCLRIREAGDLVVCAPDIELLHFESTTRGRNRTRDQIAWDHAELDLLAQRWRSELFRDPGYNPQWAVGGVPFDGFREPSLSQVLRWIDAGTAPWKVRRWAEKESDRSITGD